MLSAEEIEALHSYSGDDYRFINGCLRGDRTCSNRTLGLISLIDSAIAKYPLARPATLYRGLWGRVVEQLRATGLRSGMVLSEPAFMSCSSRRDPVLPFARLPQGLILRIAVPAGFPGLAIESYSQFPREREILLPRNTRIRILGYDATTFEVDCEVAIA